MAQLAAAKAQDKALNVCQNEILKLRFEKTRNIQKFEHFLNSFKTKHSPHLVDYMEFYHIEAKTITPKLVREANTIISIQSTSAGAISAKRQEKFDKMLDDIDDMEAELNNEDQGREDILTIAKNSLDTSTNDIEELRQEETKRAVKESRGPAKNENTQSYRLKVDSTLKPPTLTQDLKAVACRNWIKKFKLYIQSGGAINDEDETQKGIICIYLR